MAVPEKRPVTDPCRSADHIRNRSGGNPASLASSLCGTTGSTLACA